MATITRHPRERVQPGVDFQWNRKLWTHDIFRAYEMLFGRRAGLKMMASMTTFEVNGTQMKRLRVFSVEQFIAECEVLVRSFFTVPDFGFRFVLIPQLALAQGVIYGMLPIFNLALVIENHTLVVGAGSHSFSYTSTGSNLTMFAGAWIAGSTSPPGTAPTYNSVSMTAQTGANTSSAATNASLSCYTLIAPTTGAHTWACAGINDASVTTFTGSNQSAQPDSVNKVNNEGAQVNTTLVVTTIADNCMALSYFGNSTATTPSAGTGSTLLDQELTSLFATICSNSTNPITPAGNYSMTTNHASSGGNYMSIMAVAPTSTAVANGSFLPFM